MWNFKSAIAWRLLKQTGSFTSYRLGVFLGLSLCYALLAWIGWFLGLAITRSAMLNGASFNTVAALGRSMPLLFIVMFCGGLGIGMWFLRKHLYWYVRVPHLALMAELLEGRRLPAGNQIKTGLAMVKDRYGDMNRLWALRDRIEKTLPAINPLLPIRALFGLKPEGRGVGINQPLLWLAERPIDEMVLAHGLRKRAVNPYTAAREGLVLLAQNGKPVVGNAVTLQGLAWAYTMLAFVGWMLVFALIILVVPNAGPLMVIITGTFAWGTKAGLIDALGNACLLQIYVGATRGQKPNPEWEARLDKDAPAFADLGHKAAALPVRAGRTTATVQKTVTGGARPADGRSTAASAGAAPAAVSPTVAAAAKEQAGAPAFAPPTDLMPNGFVPSVPSPAPAPAPAAESAPAFTAPSAPATPPPTSETAPEPGPAPPPGQPPTPQETPVDPPRETPPPTPPEIPESEPPPEVPPSTPPEFPPQPEAAELPPLAADDVITSTPQALADAPETRATPAAISDPWAAPEPEKAAPPPVSEPEPYPEPAPRAAPPSRPATSAKTVIAPIPELDTDEAPSDQS